MSEMFVASLRNRIRAMNTIWERAVSDMTLEHVNHHERAGVLPIAFSLSHFMRAQDQSISGPFLGERPLWDAGGWAQKVGVTVDRLGREESVEEMEGSALRRLRRNGGPTSRRSSPGRTACSTRSPKTFLRRC